MLLNLKAEILALQLDAVTGAHVALRCFMKTDGPKVTFNAPPCANAPGTLEGPVTCRHGLSEFSTHYADAYNHHALLKAQIW